MRTGHFHSPAEAGVLSQTGQVGPDAVLGGCVFDPSFIPFLPFAIEPRVFPRFAPDRGLVAGADGHGSSERKIGNVRKAVGEIRNV